MAILDHMGKESSFPLPEMQIYPSPHGEGVMLASSKLVHPSPASPQNTTLPFPTNVGRILPHSKCKTPANPSLQFLYFSFCFYLSPRGATRVARGGIRLVHGLTRSTLITYFSGMKKRP